MINPFKEINWKPGNADMRKFGVTVLVGFAIIGLLILSFNVFRTGMHFKAAAFLPACLLVFSFIVFVMSRLLPKSVVPLYLVWFFLSACIGIVVSNLVLTLFYYLVFSLIAAILKLFSSREPLCLKNVTGRKTMWSDFEKVRDLKRYYRQY